jgi:hypothetical protein
VQVYETTKKKSKDSKETIRVTEYVARDPQETHVKRTYEFEGEDGEVFQEWSVEYLKGED